MPGVLLIETMAQASGFLVLAATDFAAMPFLMSVDGAKMRTFVEPEAVLDIEAFLEHDGSGFAVTKAKITSAGKKVCDAQLKLRTMPFDQVPLGRHRPQACRRSRADGCDCRHGTTGE